MNNEGNVGQVSISGKGDASPYPPGTDPLDKLVNEDQGLPEEGGSIEQTLPDDELGADPVSEMIRAIAESGTESVSGSTTLSDGREVSYSIDINTVAKGEPEPVLDEKLVEDPAPEMVKEGRVDPTPSESQKEEFDATAIQDPRIASKGPEGGVSRTSSKGPTMSSTSNKTSGGVMKQSADMMADSIANKYEMAGFEAVYEANGEEHRVHIRDYFDDLESAKATVNGNKYLMPMPGGTFKQAKIHGIPTISINDREVVAIKNEEWTRK